MFRFQILDEAGAHGAHWSDALAAILRSDE
jgi:hypothetical protein